MRLPWPLRLAMAGALAIATSFAPPLRASGLQVSPIGLHLRANAQAEALWLTNTGAETIHAQVRVFRWTQRDGKDRYEASRDLVVSPPMVTIAPGDRQMVRVIRQAAPPDGAEASYRVIVDELPTNRPKGLEFVLRYSIPVFVAPKGDASVRATLSARWSDSAEGPRLQVSNEGNGHAQIADLVRVDDHGRRTPLLPGLVGYALPGSAMTWPLPSGTPIAGGVLKARINGETSESTLVAGTGDR
ncbi:molecular chaperone [Luteibacter aegosomatis]|uniref:fimbrial biogenesis chaperone n=1 Tax=Luteibacter aegosomatis TaxID=2911537 RepID=UPI001FFA2421|nr:molecular chaperone [Luteibacter aegosomatis]UPG86159.1 molecular chaperone [Luteibacter aegosomatis]